MTTIRVTNPAPKRVGITVPDESRKAPVSVGYPGPVGPRGQSAYELAVQEGFTGTLSEFLSQYDVNVNYNHTQDVPSEQWTIPHNLGYKPNVTIFDNEGNNIEGDISHSSINQMVITFAIQISGTAILS